MKLLTTDEKTLMLHKLQSNTKYMPNGCWIFLGFKHGVHYRGFWFGGKRWLAHRASAGIYLGLDMDNTNLQANHKNICTSKYCWNPDHLYIGTQQDNMTDLSIVLRDSEKHCKKCGHLRTLVNTTSRGKPHKRLECNNCRKTRYHKKKNAA